MKRLGNIITIRDHVKGLGRNPSGPESCYQWTGDRDYGFVPLEGPDLEKFI